MLPCCILFLLILILAGLASIITIGVLQSQDSGKDEWTTATCYSCNNFAISGSDECAYASATCNHEIYDAYIKYPRTDNFMFCNSKYDVTQWLESIKGKNISCALEYIDQNTDGYPKCASNTDNYCYRYFFLKK